MSATPTFGSAKVRKEGLFARLAKHASRFTRTLKVDPRAAVRAGYPKTGTGLSHGARLERQHAAGMLDFSASGKCLVAIDARRDRCPAFVEAA